MASLFSQKALINVVGGKVPEVAKSQMTRPLTTVFYALNILYASLFSQSCIMSHIHTHNVFFAYMCGFVVQLSSPVPERWREWTISDISVSLLLMSKWQSVSCPQLSAVLCRKHTWTHQQRWSRWCALVSCLHAQHTIHPVSVPWLFIPLHWRRTRCEVEAVRPKEERATVPIFRPVNKLQKQMDLGAEIHLAPLGWLKPPIADLF